MVPGPLINVDIGGVEREEESQTQPKNSDSRKMVEIWSKASFNDSTDSDKPSTVATRGVPNMDPLELTRFVKPSPRDSNEISCRQQACGSL